MNSASSLPPKRSRRSANRKAVQDGEPPGLPSVEEWPKGENLSGLPILPDELYLEILSYFPPVPLPTNAREKEPIDTDAWIARRDTLYALSRASSNMRRFFHPYVWERIEVKTGMKIGDKVLGAGQYREDKKAYATELIRQLEVVTIRDPSLADYVKVFNAEITEFSIHNVMIEVARCLALFPNAHTVKLTLDTTLETSAQRAFRKYNYPQIRTLICSVGAYPLIPSCPNLRSMQCTECAYTEDLCRWLKDSIGLEEILNVRLGTSGFPTRLDFLVNIRHLTVQLWWWLEWLAGDIEKLSCFPQLQSITFDLHPSGSWSRSIVNDIVDVARRVLLNHQRRDQTEKRIAIIESQHGFNLVTVLQPPRGLQPISTDSGVWN